MLELGAIDSDFNLLGSGWAESKEGVVRLGQGGMYGYGNHTHIPSEILIENN
jgi:hypothetical protein